MVGSNLLIGAGLITGIFRAEPPMFDGLSRLSGLAQADASGTILSPPGLAMFHQILPRFAATRGHVARNRNQYGRIIGGLAWNRLRYIKAGLGSTRHRRRV